jgi:DnaJ-class molecular chaperone
MATIPGQKVMTPGPRPCGTCKGTGVVPVTKAGHVVGSVTCPACRGQKTGTGLMTK